MPVQVFNIVHAFSVFITFSVVLGKAHVALCPDAVVIAIPCGTRPVHRHRKNIGMSQDAHGRHISSVGMADNAHSIAIHIGPLSKITDAVCMVSNIHNTEFAIHSILECLPST
jgi:hypothetical protein